MSVQRTSNTNDTFLTLAEPAHLELPKIKGSRFIGDVVPLAVVEQAEDMLDQIRERESDATHHCWAYRIGAERDIFRYSDDGEPSGTAGQPILRQIDGRDLTDVIVVITRYYGGTNLGTGGLVHAYSEAAEAVLDAGEIVERVLRKPVRLSFSYDDTSAVRQVLHKFDAEVAESNYTDITELVVQVRRSEVEAFTAAVTNALGGRGSVTPPEAAC